MRSLLVFTILWGVNTLLHAQSPNAKIEVFYGTYEGQSIRVKILPIGEPEEEEVLLQITGTTDSINNHIYKYKKEWQSSDKRLNQYLYVTHDIPCHERFQPFHSVHSYGSQYFKLYLMSHPMTPIYLETGYDENLDPGFMYDQYIKQQEERKKVK